MGYGGVYHSAGDGTVVSGSVKFTGDLAVAGGLDLAKYGDILQRPGEHADSGAQAPVDGTSYAVYLGRTLRKITSARVSVFVGSTAAATVAWAEVGLATGAFEGNVGDTAGTPNLTRAGFASIATEIAAGINREAGALVTPATPIAAGSELWLLFGVSAATLPVMRSIPNAIDGSAASAAATRPSTMAAGAAFTASQLGAAVPGFWYAVEVVS